MPNKIYIVACEMSMQYARSGLVDSRAGSNGLWANVGQTIRDVSDRLRDNDYKRKAVGGKLQILFVQNVGDSLTDHQVHPFLKRHPEVSWDRNSSNTEEFFFKGDPGDGSVARRIVSEILRQICVPLLQQEVSRLQGENESLASLLAGSQDEIAKREEIIRQLSSGEIVQKAMTELLQLEDENRRIISENESLRAESRRVEEVELVNKQLRESQINLRRDLRAANEKTKLERADLESLQSKYTFVRSGLLTLTVISSLVSGAIGHSVADSSWVDSLSKLESKMVTANSFSDMRWYTDPTSTAREVSEMHDQISFLRKERDRARLVAADLKLELDSKQDRSIPRPAKKEKFKPSPPVPLDPANQKKYDDLYSLLGKSEADKYALGIAKNPLTNKVTAPPGPTPTSAPAPDDMRVLDSQTLSILLNSQVLPAAVTCFDRLLGSTSLDRSEIHTSLRVGILPGGEVSVVRVLSSQQLPSSIDGDPMKECVVPAVESSRIEAPGIELIGDYQVDLVWSRP